MCTPLPVFVVIARLRAPLVDVANDCDACVDPLSEVRPPPAPASAAHANVPSVQINFCVDELQLESDAPKSVPTVRPPVEDALTKLVLPERVVTPLTVNAVAEALASVV